MSCIDFYSPEFGTKSEFLDLNFLMPLVKNHLNLSEFILILGLLRILRNKIVRAINNNPKIKKENLAPNLNVQS